MLHLGKDDGSFPPALGEKFGEKGVFVPSVYEENLLSNLFDGRRLRGDGDVNRVLNQSPGESDHFRLHGGGEEEGLAARREQGDYPANVREKTHVEHPVGFVEDEGFDVSKGDKPLADQVEKPSRRGDENMEPFVQGRCLRVLPDSSEDHSMAEGEVTAVRGGRISDLGGQFPCWGKNEDPGASLERFSRFADQELQYRQHEGGGLPCSGLGASDQVPPLEKVGDGLALNGGGREVPGFGDGSLKFGQETAEDSL